MSNNKKRKQNLLPIIVNAIVTIFAVIISSYISFNLAKSNELETRKYELTQAVLSEVLGNVIQYSNYSTVRWEEVENLYLRPYNCDWDEKYDKYIDYSNAETNLSSTYGQIWHLLQNAKEDFKKKTTKARIIGSEQVISALGYVEAGFDEVFLKAYQITI